MHSLFGTHGLFQAHETQTVFYQNSDGRFTARDLPASSTGSMPDVPGVFDLLQRVLGACMPSTESLDEALSLNQKLRSQITSYHSGNCEVMPLDRHVYDVFSILYEALEEGQEDGIFNAALLKILHKDFLSKVINAVCYDVIFDDLDVLQKDLQSLVVSFNQSIGEDRAQRFWESFLEIVSGLDASSVSMAHSPVTHRIRDYMQLIMSMVDDYVIDTAFQHKHPKITEVLNVFKDALSMVLSRASDYMTTLSATEERSWKLEEVFATLQGHVEQALERQYQLILQSPDCLSILMSDLEIHAKLTEVLRRQQSQNSADSTSTDLRPSSAWRQTLLRFFALSDYSVRTHTSKLVARYEDHSSTPQP